HSQTIKLQRNLTVQSTSQSDGSITGVYDYITPSGGSYTWNGGAIGDQASTGQTIIQSNATMDVNNLAHTLATRSLQIYGTLNWHGNAQLNQVISASSSAMINVQASGKFTVVDGGTYTINAVSGGSSPIGPNVPGGSPIFNN